MTGTCAPPISADMRYLHSREVVPGRLERCRYRALLPSSDIARVGCGCR
jgi:hypothetical protein